MRFEYTPDQREALENFVNTGGRFHHIYTHYAGEVFEVTTIAYRRRPDGMVEYAAATWHMDEVARPAAFSRQENIAHALVRFNGSPVVVPDTTVRLREKSAIYMQSLADQMQTDILTLGRLNRRFHFLEGTPASWQDSWWTNTLGRYGHTGAINRKIQEREARALETNRGWSDYGLR